MANVYRVVECAKLRGEPQRFMILRNGVQLGGDIDSSGAGNAVYDSLADAWAEVAGMATSREMTEALAADDESGDS